MSVHARLKVTARVARILGLCVVKGSAAAFGIIAARTRLARRAVGVFQAAISRHGTGPSQCQGRGQMVVLARSGVGSPTVECQEQPDVVAFERGSQQPRFEVQRDRFTRYAGQVLGIPQVAEPNVICGADVYHAGNVIDATALLGRCRLRGWHGYKKHNRSEQYPHRDAGHVALHRFASLSARPRLTPNLAITPSIPRCSVHYNTFLMVSQSFTVNMAQV